LGPLVSVVMASYRDKNLHESLMSVLNQTYENIEIVLVNDDPVNKSIFDRYVGEFENLILISNEENLGLTKSLNKAVEKSRGEIVVRHDMDDFSLPGRVETLVDFFARNAAVEIVCSSAYLEIANNRSLLEVPGTHSQIVKELQYRNCLIHSALSFRRSLIQKIGLYDERYRYAQDYDFYLRAVSCGIVFATIKEPLIIKKFDVNNITFKKRKQQLLYELSAKALFFAGKEFECKCVFSIFLTLFKILIPSSLRKLRLIKWK